MVSNTLFRPALSPNSTQIKPCVLFDAKKTSFLPTKPVYVKLIMNQFFEGDKTLRYAKHFLQTIIKSFPVFLARPLGIPRSPRPRVKCYSYPNVACPPLSISPASSLLPKGLSRCNIYAQLCIIFCYITASLFPQQ
jgi:hypothetical protein